MQNIRFERFCISMESRYPNACLDILPPHSADSTAKCDTNNGDDSACVITTAVLLARARQQDRYINRPETQNPTARYPNLTPAASWTDVTDLHIRTQRIAWVVNHSGRCSAIRPTRTIAGVDRINGRVTGRWTWRLCENGSIAAWCHVSAHGSECERAITGVGISRRNFHYRFC